MKGDVPAWLTQCVHGVRQYCSVHDVHGKAYPVPLGELERWQDEQSRIERERSRKRHIGVKLYWRKIFRAMSA